MSEEPNYETLMSFDFALSRAFPILRASLALGARLTYYRMVIAALDEQGYRLVKIDASKQVQL